MPCCGSACVCRAPCWASRVVCVSPSLASGAPHVRHVCIPDADENLRWLMQTSGIGRGPVRMLDLARAWRCLLLPPPAAASCCLASCPACCRLLLPPCLLPCLLLLLPACRCLAHCYRLAPCCCFLLLTDTGGVRAFLPSPPRSPHVVAAAVWGAGQASFGGPHRIAIPRRTSTPSGIRGSAMRCFAGSHTATRATGASRSRHKARASHKTQQPRATLIPSCSILLLTSDFHARAERGGWANATQLARFRTKKGSQLRSHPLQSSSSCKNSPP